MALISCPECAAQISDKATSCPKCGCPVTITAATPSTPAADTTKPAKQSIDLVQGGYVLAVLFPAIGTIIGIVLLCKAGKRGHGGGVLALSIAMWIAWTVLLLRFG